MVFKDSGTALIRQNIGDVPELAPALSELATRFEDLKSEDLDAQLLNGINAQFKQIRKMADFARLFQEFDPEGVVYWSEKRNDKFMLNGCRLNLG